MKFIKSLSLPDISPIKRLMILLSTVFGVLIVDGRCLQSQVQSNPKQIEENQTIEFQRDSTLGSIGVYGGMGFDAHSASFSSLPNTFSCNPGFLNSTDWGNRAFGISWERPLNPSIFGSEIQKIIPHPWIGARVSYQNSIAEFSTNEQTSVLIQGQEQVGQFSHYLNTSINYLQFEAIIGAKNIWRELSIHAGLTAGYSLASSFSMGEQITQPSNRGVFPDSRQRDRNKSEGSIDGLRAFNTGLAFYAGYEIPLSAQGNWYARPELRYHFPFVGNVTGINWTTSSVRLGVNVFFAFPKQTEIGIKTYPIKEPIHVIEKPFVLRLLPAPMFPIDAMRHSLTLSVVAKDSLFKPIQVDTIYVGGFYETTVRPLLNYVFFDTLSSTLPSRYKLIPADSINSFSMKSLYRLGMIESYHHILNILALRMIELPDAKITLTGCNMGNTVEGGKTDLSRKRAETVRDYLVNVWKIDESRIRINARNLPSKPSFYGSADGDEENRRVEISSNITSLLEPVLSTDTIYSSSPTTLYVRPKSFNTNEPLRSWSLKAQLSDNVKREFNTGEEVQPEYELPLEEFIQQVNPNDTLLKFTYTGTNSNGDNATAPSVNIPLLISRPERRSSKDTVGKIVEKFSLILFEYDDASFTPQHERTLELIRSKITPVTEVFITGYSDRMGDDDYNQRLSEKRAKSIAKALGISKQSNIIGMGETVQLYNNNIPEGRFYCRTIDIRLEHPLK
jgi:outer membrane protein OmpA-like peptidoglycan-associated protein